jgi:hypothetical protein
MRLAKKYFRTVLAIIVVIILFVGFHMYNHLQIQSRRFTDEWGRGIKIDTCGMNYAPMLGNYEDKILVVGFERDGSVSYVLYRYDGIKIDEGNSKLEGFNKNRIQYIKLFENNLLYVKDSNLYRSIYTEEDGFQKPQILLENVKGFNGEKIDGELWIQVFNDENIELYTLNNGKLSLSHSFKNLWDIKSIYLSNYNNKKHLFIFNKADNVTDEILVGTIDDIKKNSLKTIETIKYLSQIYIEDIDIKHYNNDFYIAYGLKEILPGGGRNNVIGLVIVDSSTLKVKLNKRIYNSDIKEIEDLDSKIAVYTDEKGVKLICSGINLMNKYAESNDIFIIDINRAGRIKNVKFISNTEKYSKTPRILETNYGNYLTWIDVEGGGYEIMLNSTNMNFKVNTKTFTYEDYKIAFLKALATPLLALVSTFLIGNKMLLYISVLFLPLGYYVRKNSINNEKIKFIMFIGAYILLNLLTFKGTYYSGMGSVFIPNILKSGLVPYMVPILINIVSGILLFLFHKDKKNMNYIVYVLFFIGIDIYLNNFFYVPFTMIKIL